MPWAPRARWDRRVGDWNVVWVAEDENGEIRRYARSARDLSDMTKLLEEAIESGSESIQFKKVWEK